MDSAKMLNIPSTVKDPNYRYKMPKIQATTQGSGGNVKTKLENIKEVAHALTVPPDYPLKFIGRELGSQTEIKNDVYLINGSHTPDKLQQLLDKFIDKYVLCPKCKLPETRIFIKSNEIRCKCRACGTISKLDDKHKFSNHIKNFPPKYDEEHEKGPVVDDKEVKFSQMTSAGQAQKPVIDKETKIKIKNSMEKINKLLEGSDNIQDIQNKIETLLNENKLDMQVKYFVLINSLFDKNIYSQLKTRIPIVKYFLSKEDENSAQEALFHIIAAIADLTSNRFKDIGRFVPSILYSLYLTDLITEDFWIKYAIKSSLNFTSPFLTREIENKFFDNSKEFSHWIENAPYEDEEDKVYRGMVEEVRETKPQVENLAKQPVEDLDIDNI